MTDRNIRHEGGWTCARMIEAEMQRHRQNKLAIISAVHRVGRIITGEDSEQQAIARARQVLGVA